jgi:hypothetical protein
MVATYKGPAGELQLTANDRLLAARGILGEGDENPSDEVMRAYLWAIMRRCLLRATPIGYGTMWRLFSQPINPEWQADGAFCREGGLYHGKDECSSEKLARREKTSGTKWEDIPEKIRIAVDKFAEGALAPPMTERSLPPGRNRLSNWASYKNVKKKYPWGAAIGGEWFLEDRPMMAGEVTVVGGSAIEPSSVFLKLSAVGLLIAAVLSWWVFYRR